jgi:hypothetical protein
MHPRSLWAVPVPLMLAVLAAATLAPAPARAADCVWGRPGYRDCVEEKIRRLRESEARGDRPDTAPAGPPATRPQTLPHAPSMPPPPPAPPRQWRVGPSPEEERFARDVDDLRRRIDRTGPSAPSVRDVDRELLRMSGDSWRLPAGEANARQFETDMLRRRAMERELFSDPPNSGRPALP